MPVIDQVIVHEVVVPSRAGALNSEEFGQYFRWDLMPICILQIQCPDGLVGLGEVLRGNTLEQLRPCLAELPGKTLRGWGPPLPLPTGWPPPDDGLQTRLPKPLWQSQSPLAGALEMAAADIAAKRLGCRVVDLLGGACRQGVAVDYWCARQTPRDLHATVQRARGLGFVGLKMKARLGDPVMDQVQAIKSAGGADFSITIDPMFQWHSPSQTMGLLKSLESLGSNLRIEDPYPHAQVDMWHRARSISAIPLVWHARDIDNLALALRQRCADDFNCGGGLREFLTLSAAVEVAGLACWHSSTLELGVAQAAHLHAAAAARSCALPSDLASPLIREHSLTTWNWPYRDGHIELPDAPGLGVELDLDALRHYSRAHATFTRAGEQRHD